MSGRFAGSKTVDERRRRRLATEDPSAAAVPAAAGDGASDADRPLPIRRPTARFPLQRAVSRSSWKLAAAAFAAATAAVAAAGVGFVPGVRGGAYGPGLASFAAEGGRLPSAVGGLLLIAAGQLAWVVRWARGRSLRDFRGRYRVWWWASAACVLAGVAVLTAAPAALAATLTWAAGPPPVGGDAAWATLPVLAALVLLFPGLRRDTRECRTSRTFLTLAAALWLAAVGGTAGEAPLAPLLARAAAAIGPGLIGTGLVLDGLWLAGAVATFVGMLAHVRHVVYESVEPPAAVVKAAKAAAEPAAGEPADEADPKASKPAEKRTGRRKAAAAEPAAATETHAAPAEPAGKPHFVLKGQVLKPEPVPAPAPPAVKAVAEKAVAVKPAEPKPEPVKPEPVKAAKPEPPKPTAKAEPPKPDPKPVAAREDDWSEDAGAVEINGRKVRLDGPEDPAKGLSKRERRALKKAMKGQGRSYDDGGDED